MLGAIVGDIVGSIYEFDNCKNKDFPLFQSHCDITDDSILTCATANALLTDHNFKFHYRQFGNRYPSSYGVRFNEWIHDDTRGAYDSFGNGSAMRVSPVAWAFNSESEILTMAKASAEVTHNHVEGVKGAQATALAIFLARRGREPGDIASEIGEKFDYKFSNSVDALRETYFYNETCQATVPEAIQCFAEAEDFEDAIRNAVSIGGDSDTLAAITGSIAEAAFGIPGDIEKAAVARLDDHLRQILLQFRRTYCK